MRPVPARRRREQAHQSSRDGQPQERQNDRAVVSGEIEHPAEGEGTEHGKRHHGCAGRAPNTAKVNPAEGVGPYNGVDGHVRALSETKDTAVHKGLPGRRHAHGQQHGDGEKRQPSRQNEPVGYSVGQPTLSGLLRTSKTAGGTRITFSPVILAHFLAGDNILEPWPIMPPRSPII